MNEHPLPDTRAARSAILGLLRGGTPPVPRPRPDLAPYHAGPYGRGTQGQRPDPATLVAGFEAAARGWRAEVRHAQPETWPAVLREALDAHGCRRVAIGTAPRLQAGLAEALQGLHTEVFDRPLDAWKTTLFDAVDAGITDTVAGIADTGTLVLRTGPHEPRTLSLVPQVHLALLRTSTLYAGLPAAFQALAPEADMPSNLLLVTGPSKTADIQQVLAYGAHGPKVLVVVLVHDTTPPAGEPA
ncbi:MAG: lactate utilization protein C [Rubrivivax sp.]|nr:lactate utilization protein C [Rubrivivax sp.]